MLYSRPRTQLREDRSPQNDRIRCRRTIDQVHIIGSLYTWEHVEIFVEGGGVGRSPKNAPQVEKNALYKEEKGPHMEAKINLKRKNRSPRRGGGEERLLLSSPTAGANIFM